MGESLATHSEQVKGMLGRSASSPLARTEHIVTRLSDTLRRAEPLRAGTTSLSLCARAADTAPLVTLVTLGSAALGALRSALSLLALR